MEMSNWICGDAAAGAFVWPRAGAIGRSHKTQPKPTITIRRHCVCISIALNRAYSS
jgi:hypothetical protein